MTGPSREELERLLARAVSARELEAKLRGAWGRGPAPRGGAQGPPEVLDHCRRHRRVQGRVYWLASARLLGLRLRGSGRAAFFLRVFPSVAKRDGSLESARATLEALCAPLAASCGAINPFRKPRRPPAGRPVLETPVADWPAPRGPLGFALRDFLLSGESKRVYRGRL